ncbi:MAG: polyprenyl synthetase family protein [Candidatus Eiseniibacteriota bacterium]
MAARRETLPTFFERDRRAFDAWLAQRLRRLPGVPDRLAEALRYAVLAPGKRLRPLLVLLGYDAGGGPRAARRRAFAAAAALEYVHAFSLVHDDLPALDDDDLRRGRPTLHRKFDEATAILAGDALLSLAFEHLAGAAFPPARVAEALAILARASGASGMVAGQMLDLAAEGRWGRARAAAARRLSNVRAIHRNKTGELLAAALEIGGTLAGATAHRRAALRAVGIDLGLAFQIEDDLLNERGDTRALGKRSGTDRVRGKATWPAAVGTRAAERAVARLHARAVGRAAKVFPRFAGRFATLAAFLAARRA